MKRIWILLFTFLTCLVLLSACGNEDAYDYDTTFPSGSTGELHLEFSTSTPAVSASEAGTSDNAAQGDGQASAQGAAAQGSTQNGTDVNAASSPAADGVSQAGGTETAAQSGTGGSGGTAAAGQTAVGQTAVGQTASGNGTDVSSGTATAAGTAQTAAPVQTPFSAANAKQAQNTASGATGTAQTADSTQATAGTQAVTQQGTAEQQNTTAQQSTVTQAAATQTTATPVPTVYYANEVTITKSPTSETVYAGGSALFIARANNATSINWILVSPDAKTSYRMADVPSQFSGVTLEGNGTENLRLSNIPVSMSGWRVQCYFTGEGGPKYTSGAYLTVLNATANPIYTSYPWATATPVGDLETLTQNLAVANAKQAYNTAVAYGYTATDITGYSYSNGTATYSMTFSYGAKAITAQFRTSYSTGSGPMAVYYYTGSQAYTEDLTGQSMDTFYSRLVYFKTY